MRRGAIHAWMGRPECSVQVQQGVPRRGDRERQVVPVVRRAEGRQGAAHGARQGQAAPGQALLRLRLAGPLRRRHEDDRQGLLIEHVMYMIE